jgi:hypothetical protein
MAGVQQPIGPVRRFVLRAIAIFLAPIGIALVAFPFADLIFISSAGLVEDTRAYFGAGTPDGMPAVTGIYCVPEHYGTSRRGMTIWECRLSLGATPAAGGKGGGGAVAAVAGMPSELERDLGSDATGQRPTLRLLSAPGEPAVLGVVWSGSELSWHWIGWAFQSALIFGFGGLCLFAAVLGWRKARPAPAV